VSLPRTGELRPLPANAPLQLDDPETGWLLESGRVQVFAARHESGRPAARHPLFSVGPGGLLLAPPRGAALALVAVGLEDDSVARPLPLAELGAGDAHETVQLVEGWISALAECVTISAPIEGVGLAVRQQSTVPAGQSAWAAAGVVWLADGGALHPYEEEPEDRTTIGLLPLPPKSWARASQDVSLTPLAGPDALARPETWAAGLARFERAVLARIARDLAAAAEAIEQRHEQRRIHDEELLERSYTRLGAVLERGPSYTPLPEERDPLFDAFRAVCTAVGVEAAVPPRSASVALADPIEAMGRASGVRVRQVVLDAGWWRHDSGPLLCRLAGDLRPVAVLPRAGGGYEIVDQQTRMRIRVGNASAALLAPEAVTVYRPLPFRPVTGRDVWRFVLRPVEGDLRRLALYGLGAGALSLVTPIVTETIFGRVVPGQERSSLLWLTLLLAALAVGSFTFALAQRLAFLRVDGRAMGDLQAALWDRLLDLPSPFFRRYSAGSLTIRAMGIEQIRLLATAAVVAAALAIPIGLFSLGLTFVLQPRLALFGLLAIALTAAVMVVFMRSQLPRQRRIQAVTRELFGTSMQLVEAVGKLRVAAAERRGFARWAASLGALKEAFYDAQLGFVAMTAFIVAAPAIATALILIGAATLPRGSISGATFIAFNTAFIQALAAVTGLVAVATFISQAVPLYETTRTILEERRETDVLRSDPGELLGDVDVSGVSLRYDADSPLVLDDVSFRAGAGEFVAIVGPSGAGKSSILRVLLGFETPEVGAVHYDGKELGTLDPRAFRRQIGVVLQSARLTPGDIFTNIVGARRLTMEDAWAAAEIAGLADDIRRLPMGMQTVVSEGASTFSGGQRQRLLIARAVAGRPRILLFDEATSALDNRTQAEVSDAIHRLRATRIVIAHRLSTVARADRIVVLEAGRIVQSGTYEQLMAIEGPFRRLARRQLA
jgi:NHLM bacteriocin system ABC transporter ATP-binding protein